MASGFLMGLDLGGGSVRVLLYELASGDVTAATRAVSSRPAPDTAGLGHDLDLALVWKELAAASREALARADAAPEAVLGVAPTAMRIGMVVIDEGDEALLAVPNRDARAVAEGLWLASEHGEALLRRGGHWPLSIYAAARLRWMATRHPERLARAAALLSLSDWIAWRLCGQLAAEASQAGETLLFDLERRDWAWDWIERLELPRHLFPPLREPGSRLGALGGDAAEALGLRAGTPVLVGGADSQCGLLGAGAVAPGDVAAITGTTAPVQLVLDAPRVDPDGRLWTGHHLPAGRWVLESNAGPMGESLAWLARVLYPDSPRPAAALFAEAALAEPGAPGMLSTVGAQVMNAREPTIPVADLSFSHLAAPDDTRSRPLLARSVVEGMACALRANLAQLERVAGVRPGRLRLTGGLSRSPTWAAAVAGVLGAEIEVTSHAEASALGAALCAGVGVGVFDDLTAAAAAAARATHRVRPDDRHAEAYAEAYASWSRMREARADSAFPVASILTPAALRASAGHGAPSADLHRPRVLVTADLDAGSLARLRALGDVEYQSFREKLRLLTGPALVEALSGVEVFVTEVDVVDAAALGKLPDLRVVVACRGDAVNVDVEACSAFGIPVLRAPGRNADAVADLTLAFLLMLARRLPDAVRFLRAPEVEAGDMGQMGRAFSSLRGRELWRRTIGLVGLGAVGRAVARRLAPFGARVLVSDPYVDAERAALLGAESVPLERLLGESDFVSLHAAVTDETRGLLGAAELARMRPGAFLVNTARAALVDEEALLEALASGHLGGAALDAFAVEPPGHDHPLLALDNVIATPHVGGNTTEIAAHQGEIVADELERLLRGERPRHVVDPAPLEAFRWTGSRPRPDPERVAALAARPGPAVSDLQREPSRGATRPASGPAAGAQASAAAEPASAPDARRPAASRAQRLAVERIVDAFAAGIAADAELRDFARGRDVTLHFTLPDVGLDFHFRLREGDVEAHRGAPEATPDVALRMRAEILDGMFTGRVNAMEAAMQGRLSFTGDAAKAMTLQHMQDALSRLYRAAREEAGDPGDLTAIPDVGGGASNGTTAAGARAPGAAPADDVRHQIVATVQELYATQLVTATGGNVSARIPGKDELWITPSQLFKGDLGPEVLVHIDLDGRPLAEGQRSPSSEWMMHAALYRARDDVRAVVHAHAPHATILANAGLPFLPISTEAAFFADLPRVPFLMPGTGELARAVAEAMGPGWAVLMQNHGLLVAGRSLRRAADMVEIIERSSEVILGCYAVGREPPTLPDDVVETLRKMGDLVA